MIIVELPNGRKIKAAALHITAALDPEESCDHYLITGSQSMKDVDESELPKVLISGGTVIGSEPVKNGSQTGRIYKIVGDMNVKTLSLKEANEAQKAK